MVTDSRIYTITLSSNKNTLTSNNTKYVTGVGHIEKGNSSSCSVTSTHDSEIKKKSHRMQWNLNVNDRQGITVKIVE